MAAFLSRYAEQVEQATPAARDRHVDLLRAVAIAAVVLGHWLVAAVFTREDGRLDGLSALGVADWTHWFTWFFQVMPIFFFVGGYANAVSWRRHADAGGRWPAWVHRRSLRLLHPTAAFVAVAATAFALVRLGGVDADLVALAGWVSGIALWFLAVYVAVAALTPLTVTLHDRFGGRVIVALAVVVAVGDGLRIATGEPAWANANFLLGWVLVHQAGYWWHDGVLREGAAALPIAGAGALGLAVLVGAGPWPVSMVDVPGAVIQNSSPPSLALLALFAVQLGVALAIAPRARAWLQRRVAWAVVATVNRYILTLFLWHMVPVLVGAVALHGTGLLPEPEPTSAAWFAWRPVWLAALLAVAAVLVAAFAPVEQRTGRPVAAARDRPVAAKALGGVGVLVTCVGLVQLTLGGLSTAGGPLGLPVVALVLFFAGTGMVMAAGRLAPQSDRG